MLRKVLVFFVLQLLATSFATDFQNLEFVVTSTKLPYPGHSIAAVFDGEDSIYLLGSSVDNVYHSRDILKYSIETGELQLIGQMPDIRMGSAVWAGNGNVFYFSGYHNTFLKTSPDIWYFNIRNPSSWSSMGNMTRPGTFSSSVWDGEDNIYIYGGHGEGVFQDAIRKYKISSNSIEEIAQFPTGRRQTASIWNKATGTSYVFGGVGAGNEIVKFSPIDKSVTKLNETLPERVHGICAIWTGTEAYILGGRSSYRPYGGVVRFNPSTLEVANVSVANFPELLSSHGCAYVEKLARVYIFGGAGNNTYFDNISYIDLNPENPTTTTTPKPNPDEPCEDTEDWTLLPNPFCCESFYQCYNHKSVLYHCPDKRQFSTVSLKCELPDVVGCITTRS